jgi:hypothetical protein
VLVTYKTANGSLKYKYIGYLLGILYNYDRDKKQWIVHLDKIFQ